MSSSYDEYLQEYSAKLAKVRTHLASGNRSPEIHRECEKLLSNARRCVIAMQGLALIDEDIIKKNAAQMCLEREIAPLQKEVERFGELYGSNSRNSSSGSRSELFGSAYRAPDLLDDNQDDDMQRLLQDSESLLMESQALCSNSEQIGSGVIQQMGTQREQLEMSSARVRETAQFTMESRRILKEMGSKALRNKLFLYTVIALLVLANGAVLYHIVFKK